jgi:hypothetical protein
MVMYEEHLRSRGGPGEVVQTDAIHWLMERFDLEQPDAVKVRNRANRELKRGGYIERINVRGPYVRILK